MKVSDYALSGLILLLFVLAGCQTPPASEPEPEPEPEPARTLIDLVVENDRTALEDLFGLQVDLNQQDDQGMTALHHASARGDAATVQVLLDRGAATDIQDNEGRTPLLRAVDAGHTAVVALLAQRSADIFIQDTQGNSPLTLILQADASLVTAALTRETVAQRDQNGYTPLHHLAAVGRVDTVDHLLAVGADVTARTSAGEVALDLALARPESTDHIAVAMRLIRSGSPGSRHENLRFFERSVAQENWNLVFENRETALHIAGRNGYAGIAAILLQEGTELDGANVMERTALFVAVAQAHPAVALVLLEAGARRVVRDLSENGLYHAALHSPDPEGMVRFLLDQRVDPDLPNAGGNRALHLALLQEHHSELVSLLLSGGADPNARNQRGRSALHLAVEMENQAVVQLLIRADGSIFGPDDQGVTPAAMAVESGEPVLQWLIDAAGPTRRDGDGNNLLHIAASADRAASVGFLLDRDVPLQERNRWGDTPLHRAVREASGETALLLLEAGGDLWGVNNAGNTPLSIAFSREDPWWNRFFIPEVVARRDASGNTLLHHAVQEGDIRATAGLLARGAPLEAQNRDGQTVAHTIAVTGDPALLNLLLSQRLGVTARDSRGNTPMHLVAGRRSVEVAQLLFDAGAQADLRNSEGRTPLHEAVRRSSVELVEYFLERGVSAENRDNRGRTPLFDAVQAGSRVLAEALVRGGASLHARDQDGATPLHVSIAEGHYALAALGRSAGADIFAENGSGIAVIAAAFSRGLPAVSALVDQQTVNRQNNRGDTAVHLALLGDAPPEAIEYLLSLNPDLELRNSRGMTVARLLQERSGTSR